MFHQIVNQMLINANGILHVYNLIFGQQNFLWSESTPADGSG